MSSVRINAANVLRSIQSPDSPQSFRHRCFRHVRPYPGKCSRLPAVTISRVRVRVRPPTGCPAQSRVSNMQRPNVSVDVGWDVFRSICADVLITRATRGGEQLGSHY